MITATLCAVLEEGTIIGWLENSGFMVREIEVDGSLAPLDFASTALAVNAKYFDMKAAEAGVVGISSLIAKRRVKEQNTGNLPAELREAAFERATVQILDKLQDRSVVGVLLVEQ